MNNRRVTGALQTDGEETVSMSGGPSDEMLLTTQAVAASIREALADVTVKVDLSALRMALSKNAELVDAIADAVIERLSDTPALNGHHLSLTRDEFRDAVTSLEGRIQQVGHFGGLVQNVRDLADYVGALSTNQPPLTQHDLANTVSGLETLLLGALASSTRDTIAATVSGVVEREVQELLRMFKSELDDRYTEAAADRNAFAERIKTEEVGAEGEATIKLLADVCREVENLRAAVADRELIEHVAAKNRVASEATVNGLLELQREVRELRTATAARSDSADTVATLERIADTARSGADALSNLVAELQRDVVELRVVLAAGEAPATAEQTRALHDEIRLLRRRIALTAHPEPTAPGSASDPRPVPDADDPTSPAEPAPSGNRIEKGFPSPAAIEPPPPPTRRRRRQVG